MEDKIDILFANHLIADIETGKKTHTIRLGWRDYRPGIAVAGCPIAKWCRNIEIRTVMFTVVKYVNAVTYGYTGLDDFIESMRQYYSDFGINSPVTIIGFVLA